MTRWLLAGLRHWLGLPGLRCRTWQEPTWVAMDDGVRLATHHFWPIGLPSAPTLLIRTPYGCGRGSLLFGQLLAEFGYHVLLQDVRGRYRSEGRFTPYVDEGRDGGATLEWIASQSWCSGPIGLLGASYMGYAAWAALGAAPDRVAALVVAIGTRDLYAFHYPGGAFHLSSVFQWAVGLGEHESTPPRNLDFDRGLRFRPLIEADRVAARRVDYLRDWLSHPRRDGFWDGLRPALPESSPPTLLIAGWYDFFLDAQLADHAGLVDRDRDVRLVIGPWSHGRSAGRAWRSREHSMLGVSLRETLRFLDRHLRDDGPASQETSEPVRFFMPGSGWRGEDHWPPPGAQTRSIYLRSGGAANSQSGDGQLDWEASETDDPPDSFEHDPDHPVPSTGGPLPGRPGGAVDQRPLEARRDVLCYTSSPLEQPLAIAGPVRLALHASSDGADADFVAKLVDVSPDGLSLNVCEGITRARWRGRGSQEKDPEFLEPDTPEEFSIELSSTAWRFDSGHRIRLQIASSNFPRFDRNPGTRADPARASVEDCARTRQRVYHSPQHPSQLLLPVLEG